jgi:hypothetical protein
VFVHLFFYFYFILFFYLLFLLYIYIFLNFYFYFFIYLNCKKYILFVPQVKIVREKSAEQNSNLKVVALDHLGQITSALIKNASVVKQEHASIISSDDVPSTCYCGDVCASHHGGNTCSLCHMRFHGECLGEGHSSDLDWRCRRCSMATTLTLTANGFDDSSVCMLVLQDLLFRHQFADDSETDPVCLHARKLNIAQWVCQRLREVHVESDEYAVLPDGPKVLLILHTGNFA